MHCNQAFCGNGVSVGQCYGYNTGNPPQQNNCLLYPEIVGEGEVTSIPLPDGTVQLFFTPTLKWWTPHASNTFPCYTDTTNINNNNPYWSPSIGTWFVRSITGPGRLPPPLTCPSNQRNEAPRPFYSSNCNLNLSNTGYNLKFHNDERTSTTDLHYFYPSQQQYDCTFSLPSKGCAAVQVDTPVGVNTICHYEVIQAKPCLCTSKQCHESPLPKPPSAMSLVEIKTKSKDVLCKASTCKFEQKTFNNTGTLTLETPNISQHSKSCSSDNIKQELHLLPTDVKKKRIKLGCRKKTGDCKGKDAVCACKPPPNLDKSIATYIDQASGRGPREQGPTEQGPTDHMLHRYEGDPAFRYPYTASNGNDFRVTRKHRDKYKIDCCSKCSCYSDTDETDSY